MNHNQGKGLFPKLESPYKSPVSWVNDRYYNNGSPSQQLKSDSSSKPKQTSYSNNGHKLTPKKTVRPVPQDVYDRLSVKTYVFGREEIPENIEVTRWPENQKHTKGATPFSRAERIGLSPIQENHHVDPYQFPQPSPQQVYWHDDTTNTEIALSEEDIEQINELQSKLLEVLASPVLQSPHNTNTTHSPYPHPHPPATNNTRTLHTNNSKRPHTPSPSSISQSLPLPSSRPTTGRRMVFTPVPEEENEEVIPSQDQDVVVAVPHYRLSTRELKQFKQQQQQQQQQLQYAQQSSSQHEEEDTDENTMRLIYPHHTYHQQQQEEDTISSPLINNMDTIPTTNTTNTTTNNTNTSGNINTNGNPLFHHNKLMLLSDIQGNHGLKKLRSIATTTTTTTSVPSSSSSSVDHGHHHTTTEEDHHTYTTFLHTMHSLSISQYHPVLPPYCNTSTNPTTNTNTNTNTHNNDSRTLYISCDNSNSNSNNDNDSNIKVLGRGKFAAVYGITCSSNSDSNSTTDKKKIEQYALKIAQYATNDTLALYLNNTTNTNTNSSGNTTNTIPSKRVVEEFQREILALHTLSYSDTNGKNGDGDGNGSENVIKGYGYSLFPFAIIMEYCNNHHNLYTCFQDIIYWQDNTNKQERIALLYDILQGLQYLHIHQLIHRDIKPHNILILPNPNTHPNRHRKYLAKIADLGTAFPLSMTAYELKYQQSQVKKKKMKQKVEKEYILCQEAIGTSGYTAPEVLLYATSSSSSGDNGANEGYDYAVDMFSFGIIAWEMMLMNHTTNENDDYHKNPLVGLDPIIAYDQMMAGIRPRLNEIDHGAALSKLISTCWDSHSIRRPLACEANAQLEMIQLIYDEETKNNIRNHTISISP